MGLGLKNMIASAFDWHSGHYKLLIQDYINVYRNRLRFSDHRCFVDSSCKLTRETVFGFNHSAPSGASNFPY